MIRCAAVNAARMETADHHTFPSPSTSSSSHQQQDRQICARRSLLAGAADDGSQAGGATGGEAASRGGHTGVLRAVRQVIAASLDGDLFAPHDAQLDLSRGIHRNQFYIMRLESKPLKFSRITHHAGMTQCLGSVGGQDWYLRMAKPSIVDGAPDQSGQHDGRSPVAELP